ncbi:DMT family transporter [Notoacmeibacter ruber]|uniref:QacE family quaternary ammonium compound efflux SMR transporter n=1 Tax=Notoacmeibacter ruber TaxID=2670375 RepID=A0A3L7J929_9HYPH|nr:multidrug efflux SMR transporter [Notoacmeibacter ruber]RLQ86875.1 QacE family quaternary ammonium compound efflux SMR transporter [Notoacmeibacter ruber]
MPPLATAYFWLIIAIGFEVFATTMLKQSEQFTRLWPTIMMGLGYLATFYFMSLSFRLLPVGIAYAIWSGLGIVLIALIGWFRFGEKLDAPALLGVALILAGVLVLNLFSSSVRH